MQKLFDWLEKYLLKILIVILLFWIPLYPKLPLFDVANTWVYIRMEDFLVAFASLVLIFSILKDKTKIRTPLTKPIILYWLAGLISLIWAVLFLGPHLPLFFPRVAVLHYLRRIEYMLLFFVIAAGTESIKDVVVYLIAVFSTLNLVVFYGFGQRFLHFPAFLTMNEEFAKGVPLYLPPTARLTSTFGGHYDLAAYLVLLIALTVSFVFLVKRWWLKMGLIIAAFLSFVLLLLTASRISFFAYLLAIAIVLIFKKKKWLIIPVFLLSIFFMKGLNKGTGIRFGKTFRIEKVVFEKKTGRPIATLKQFTAAPTPTPTPVPAAVSVKKKAISTPPPSPSHGGEDLPSGTSFLALPLVSPKKQTEAKEKLISLKSLDLATVSSQIATSSGSFLLTTGNYLVKKALVYDISFTTRFQGEWPRAWQAFRRNLLLGSGYSSISLATDNDYLRSLGETGLFGFLTFWGILFALLLLIKQILERSRQPLLRTLAIGLFGGLAGLLFNAAFIDVFEASKVAFVFWMFAGLLVGAAKIYPSFGRSFWKEALDVLTSHLFLLFSLITLAVFCFYPGLKNYFTADDFIWLKWAAMSSVSEIKSYFFNSQGFFYRPLTKVFFLFLQPIFSLHAEGYHFVSFGFHVIGSLAVYFLTLQLSKKKLLAFLTSLFFLLHPIHEESIFWISGLSGLSAAVFYLLSFLFYVYWRTEKKIIRCGFWIFSIVFFAFALASHELAVTLPLMLIFYDCLWRKKRGKFWEELLYFLPFIVLTINYFYLRFSSGAHGLNGDYNYNLINLPFNFGGNFLGYLGELFFSFRFMPLYQKLRFFLRARKLLTLMVCLLAAGLVGRMALFFREKKIIVDRFIIFSFGWMVISLLPFLGLGNMSERYAYLASFGFLFVFSYFLVWLKNKFNVFVLIISVIIISCFYYLELSRANEDWRQAGQISKTTLLSLSSNYKKFSPGTNLIFVDLPVRNGLAWVFPVGLKEGILFIYKDESLRIHRINTTKEAFDLSKSLSGQSLIFVYQDGELKRAVR